MKWICLSVLTLGLLAGCGKSAPPAAPPPQVYTTPVKAQSIALRRQFVGRVSAQQSANVVARVSGVLLERLYHEGGEVRRGQRLFRIDPAYYQAQLDNDLAVLAQDHATLVNAKAVAERAHALLPVGSVSQQTVDNADAAARSAAARVQADEAMVATARLNLGFTQVVAPIDGIAGQQQVTPGTVVGGGTNDSGAGGTLLTTIEQLDTVYVNFTLSAADLVALRQAQARGRVTLAGQGQAPVTVALSDGSRLPGAGRLDFSGVLVNAATGAVNLRAIVPNPQRMLLPGMYVTLDVGFGTQGGVYLVPQQALQRDPVGAYLLTVGDDGKVVRKPITADDSEGSNWIVTQGLADGDRVIVSGLQRAREGQAVQALAWSPTAASAAAGGAN